MGQHVSRTDFEWTYTEEPHASRRKIILEKYPQIKKLFGFDPNFKWVVLLMVLVQFIMIFFVMPNRSWSVTLLIAYCFGGVINHALMLAIHEISHSLAFGHSKPMRNCLLGMVANLPIGFPFSPSFKKYHLEHHRYTGDEKKDTDIPTYIEAKLFCTTFGKLMWLILQPIFYVSRPLLVYPIKPNFLEFINVVIQIIFDGLVIYYADSRVLFGYMIMGSVLAMGLHPVAGHFISEHYMFKKGFETYSYYGPLNWISFNCGYHNEHHDFPAVPGSRLPLVKKIAPEFYENLPHHDSWLGVLYDFIMDPDIGPYARVARKAQGLAA